MNKKGFTLIEVLVIVLILSAVAAFAFPNFFRATQKSKAAGKVITMKSVLSSLERGRLATGNYPEYLEELDISLLDKDGNMAAQKTFWDKDGYKWAISTVGNYVIVGAAKFGDEEGFSYILYADSADNKVKCCDLIKYPEDGICGRLDVAFDPSVCQSWYGD